MWIDILAVLFIILMGYLGYRQGAVKQVLLIIALVMAYFLARPLSWLLQRLIPIGYIPNLIIGFIIVYAAARFAFWLVNRKLGKEKGGEVKPWNRYVGIGLGMVKGEAIVWLLACLVLAYLTAFPDFTPGIRSSVEKSVTGRIATAVNPFGFVAEFLSLTAEVSTNEAKRDTFLADPQVRSFVSDPQVQRLMNAKSLLEKLRLCDEELIAKAKRVEVMQALHRATGRTPVRVQDRPPSTDEMATGSADRPVPGLTTQPSQAEK